MSPRGVFPDEEFGRKKFFDLGSRCVELNPLEFEKVSTYAVELTKLQEQCERT